MLQRNRNNFSDFSRYYSEENQELLEKKSKLLSYILLFALLFFIFLAYLFYHKNKIKTLQPIPKQVTTNTTLSLNNEIIINSTPITPTVNPSQKKALSINNKNTLHKELAENKQKIALAHTQTKISDAQLNIILLKKIKALKKEKKALEKKKKILKKHHKVLVAKNKPLGETIPTEKIYQESNLQLIKHLNQEYLEALSTELENILHKE